MAQELELDLKTVIKIAQENNPQINIAQQQKYQKQGLLIQARSGYLPHLLVEVGAGRQYIDNLEPDDEDTVGNASISASQLIYDFGNTGGAIAAGRSGLEAAEENLQQIRKDVVFACKRGFYAVLARERLIEVEKEAVANPEYLLLEGTFVYADIFVTDKIPFLMVPPNVVLEDQQGGFVYVVDEKSQAKRVYVKCGLEGRHYLEITEGLDDGAQVIISALIKLRPGMRVAAKDTTATKGVMAVLKNR